MRQQTSIFPTPQPSRAQLVDEFGELDRQVTEFAPIARRHRSLQDEIRSWYSDTPRDQAATAEGHVYNVQVSPRSEERQFSLAAKVKIFAALKKQRFLELCSLTLKAVEMELGETYVDLNVSKDRTGSRKLIPVLKSAATQAA